MRKCVICGKKLLPRHKVACSWSCRGKYISSFRSDPWNKGIPQTDEVKKKLSDANKGKRRSPATEFNSERLRKMWADPEHKKSVSEKISLARKGEKLSEFHKASLRGPRPHLRGENNALWKGGGKNFDRRNAEYKDWQLAVFFRDNYMCRWCGKVGEKLNAHHIFPWREREELRYDVNNGVTLCLDCHNKTKNKESLFTDYFTGLFGTSNKLGTAT